MKADSGKDARLVWVLEGAHTGDNAQAHALAQALGWRVEVKPLIYNGLYRLPNWMLGSTLASLTRKSRAQLKPPWPDLVIGTGRRSVSAARWIAGRSGGDAKLVQLGRPRASLDWFDLVITTPQYDLPDRENVLQNLMPLCAPHSEAEGPDIEKWRQVFSHLERPWAGVLAGGSAWPFEFDADGALELARRASEFAGGQEGSLLVTTGPRTSGQAATALEGGINVPAYFHRWDRQADNPYAAIMTLADEFIVTGDSVSMISEACETGKPVYIFDVRCNDGFLLRLSGKMEKLRKEGGWLNWLAGMGILSPPRNVARFHRKMVAAGLAVHMGEKSVRRNRLYNDMERALARINALFE